MGAAAKQPWLSPEDYLRCERQAETRHEYYDGVVVAMAGVSKEHSRITFDTGLLIGNQLRDSSCEPFAGDMRVRVPARNRYYYPDLIVVCGEPQFEDNMFDTLLNPTVIFEVLSDSTERTDRREKYDGYTTLESLQAYILIAQDSPRLERFTRQSDGTWRFDVVQGLENALVLESIGVTLPLAEVYRRVPFPDPSSSESQEQSA
jgi:Uma2 family endonuclease